MSVTKNLMKHAAVAAAFLACGKAAGDIQPTSVQQFIADTSGYVCLKTDDASNDAASWAVKGNWSGTAPNSANDYLVQNNYVLRCPDESTSFAGRSLTLDNGRIKCAVVNGTVTFDDLRIYGGRIEPCVTDCTQTYAGNIHIHGTPAVPARFSMASTRNQIVSATLHGAADNMVQVMPTEQDASGMTEVFGECAFTADNSSTYRGRFRVAAGYHATYPNMHKIALVADNLSNLGAGDANGNSVLTIRNNGAFMAQNGFQWTNPAYSITLEGDRKNAGVIVARNAGANGFGLTLGGGMAIKSATAAAELAFRARADILMDNVQLTNIGNIIVDEGTLRLGSSYDNPGVPFVVNSQAALGGISANGGYVTFNSASSFEPGLGDGNCATLTINGGLVNGTIFGRVAIRNNGGNVTADRLISTAPVTKEAVGKITFSLTDFELPADWVGSIRLLSAPNLGEAGGLNVNDFTITGFPQEWSSVRSAGNFRIVAENGTKHLEWYVTEGSSVRVRIMPLGDSITYGSQSSLAGYREPLYQMLAGAGYDVDFVGTLQTSAGSPVTDPDHEGHRGWVTARQGNPNRCGQAADGYDGIYENIGSWLTQLGANDIPDIILLHIGTNDLLGDDFAHAKDRLGLIIDRLNELCPNAWVLVANLLDRTDNASYNEQIKTLFNPFVQEVVAARHRVGKRVAFVDLNAVVPVTELADGLHPNDAGYGHIAEAWFDAIRTIMPGTGALPSAPGETFYLTGVNALNTTSWNTELQWSSGLAPQAGNFYVLPTGTTMRTPMEAPAGTFAGEALIFNGGSMTAKGSYNSTADANWVLYSGRISHGMGIPITNSVGKIDPYILRFGGLMDVRSTREDPFLISGSGNINTRHSLVTARLVGSEDSVLNVTANANETSSTGYGFICEFAGDNSGYFGRFVADRAGQADKGGEFVIAFATQASLGAPRTDGLPNVRISQDTTFDGKGIAVTNGYELAVNDSGRIRATGYADISGLYPNEGIYFGKGGKITGNGASVVTISASSSYSVCFDDVTISGVGKIVSQRILRIYPGYDYRDLPVEVSGNSDNFGGIYGCGDGLGPVTLKSKSELQPGIGTSEPDGLGMLGMASLTVNEGAQILYSVVLTDNVLTTDFICVHGNITKNCNKIKFVFDRYPAPLTPGTEIPLLSAANLGTEITADDFEFTCKDEFLAGTVEGCFEIRDVAGEKTLFFVQTSLPVVKHTGTDASGSDSWQAAGYWEDKLPPSSGKNYSVPNGSLLRRSNAAQDPHFAGNSLSIQLGGDFAINGVTAIIDDLRLYSGGILSTRNDGDANVLQGTATVYAVKGNPFSFEIESPVVGNTRTLNLQASLKGSGDVRFRYYHTKSCGSSVKTYYLVSGDSREFTGGIELYQPAVCVDFANENAMGGEAAKFRNDRLRFTSNATMRCSSSYVMRDPTRGIYMGSGVVPLDGGRFEILAGQTLTISNLISGSSSLRAAGSGKLALCCDTNAFKGVVRNQTENGGAIVIGAAGTVAKAQLQSSPDAVWQIDAPEGMTVKNLAAVLTYGGGNQKLKVRPKAFTDPNRPMTIEANLVRFNDATLADEEAARALVELDDSALGNGWKKEIFVEEVDGALLLKVRVAKQGMIIYVK